jgi:hypothetical protein
MRILPFLIISLAGLGAIAGCQSTDKRKGIADSCYQPLYWPSEACPREKK